jgi:hypothetical protein
MRYYYFLTSTALIFYGILGLAQASVKSAPIAEIEAEMPIYYRIYNYNEGDDITILKKDLDNLALSSSKSDKFDSGPYKRSTLHRAIEHMEPELVEWLIDNNANVFHSADPTSGVYMSPKKATSKLAHLVGHLEDYYHEGVKDKVKAILTLLKGKTTLNIASYPVRTEEFKELRNDWNTSLAPKDQYDPDVFAEALSSFDDDSKSNLGSASGKSGSN